MTRSLAFDSKQPHYNPQNSSLRDTANMQEGIRQRAYELYEKRGRRDGHHEEDWLQAEQELRNKYSMKAA